MWYRRPSCRFSALSCGCFEVWMWPYGVTWNYVNAVLLFGTVLIAKHWHLGEQPFPSWFSTWTTALGFSGLFYFFTAVVLLWCPYTIPLSLCVWTASIKALLSGRNSMPFKLFLFSLMFFVLPVRCLELFWSRKNSLAESSPSVDAQELNNIGSFRCWASSSLDTWNLMSCRDE